MKTNGGGRRHLDIIGSTKKYNIVNNGFTVINKIISLIYGSKQGPATRTLDIYKLKLCN